MAMCYSDSLAAGHVPQDDVQSRSSLQRRTTGSGPNRKAAADRHDADLGASLKLSASEDSRPTASRLRLTMGRLALGAARLPPPPLSSTLCTPGASALALTPAALKRITCSWSSPLRRCADVVLTLAHSDKLRNSPARQPLFCSPSSGAPLDLVVRRGSTWGRVTHTARSLRQDNRYDTGTSYLK